MKTINANITTDLATMKDIIKNSKIENNTLIIQKDVFQGFGWLLDSDSSIQIANPLANSTPKAVEFLKDYAKKNNIDKFTIQ